MVGMTFLCESCRSKKMVATSNWRSCYLEQLEIQNIDGREVAGAGCMVLHILTLQVNYSAMHDIERTGWFRLLYAHASICKTPVQSATLYYATAVGGHGNADPFSTSI